MASLLEMLYSLGVDVRDTNEEAEKTICCPFCIERVQREDEEFKLGINVEQYVAHCFRCGWKIGWDTPNRYTVLFDALRDAFRGELEYQFTEDAAVVAKPHKKKPS